MIAVVHVHDDSIETAYDRHSMLSLRALGDYLGSKEVLVQEVGAPMALWGGFHPGFWRRFWRRRELERDMFKNNSTKPYQRGTNMKRIVFLISAILLFSFNAVSAQISPKQALRAAFEESVHNIIDETDGIIGVTIKDLVTGETMSVNGDMVFTQASAIKLEILLELFRQQKEGKFSLDDPLTMMESDVTSGSGALRRLTPGKVTMPVRDFATMMIIVSDNTATNMMIDFVGMENVNETMVELGMTETRLQRKMQDTQAGKEDRENLSTPNEATKLLEMIYKHEVLDEAACEEVLRIMSIPKNTRIGALLPPGTQVAHKTGTVGGVVVDVGIVYLENRPFIISGMANWLDDGAAGEDAIAKISLTAYKYFDRIANSNSYGHKYSP
jgi:beta-lactamase class A